jgi:hypothetical protein
MSALLAVLFVVLVGAAFYRSHKYQAVYRARLPRLRSELVAIHPFADSSPNCYDGAKVDVGVWIGCNYSGAYHSYPEIRRHYEAECDREGWHLTDDQPVRVWGQDRGGREMHYGKGQLRASVHYPGAENPGHYSLHIQWP